MNQITCVSCDAEYQILHEIDNDPIYCPFCGELNLPEETNEEYEYDDE